jgi:hypothetical protein
MAKDFPQTNIEPQDTKSTTRQIIDSFLYNFRGNTKRQRGNSWYAAGSSTSFLQSIQTVANSIFPATDNTYALGDGTHRWSDVQTVKINGQIPLSGTKVYYVSDTSGGSTTRKLTFINGILTSET